MKQLLLCGLLSSLAATVALGETESKCFQADALQGKRSVAFKLEGDQVNGTFSIETEGEEMSYDFTGTRSGDTLRVKFQRDKRPNLAPSEMKDFNWKLVTKGDSEILRIKLYGKNHETNKYADYFADFESCQPSYAALAKKAKRFSVMPSGQDDWSGTMAEEVAFVSPQDWKAFWFTVGIGQHLKIEAPGTSITLYDPDKKQDEEGGIDVLTREKISQNGDYLVVVRPAGEPGVRTVKFTVGAKSPR